jgi:hypothetical protein
MSRAKPIRIQELTDGLEAVLPSRGNAFGIFSLAVFVLCWGLSEGVMMVALVYGVWDWHVRVAAILFLAFWTVGGIFGMHSLLWLIAGKEIIILRGGTLSIRRDILGSGRTREYDFSGVTGLRKYRTALDGYGWRNGERLWGVETPGLIAFDYGRRTIRCGASIDETEASEILRYLRRRQSDPGSVSSATA